MTRQTTTHKKRRTPPVRSAHVAVGQRQRNRWLAVTEPLGVPSSSAVSNVVETLKLALTAVGSPAELARALEVTPSHVSRLRKGTAGISAELSLRLSRIVGRPALQGLRDDGHAELAALLEPIFNVGDKGTILDRSLADDLACLSDAEFTLIRDLIAAVAKPSRRGPATRR